MPGQKLISIPKKRIVQYAVEFIGPGDAVIAIPIESPANTITLSEVYRKLCEICDSPEYIMYPQPMIGITAEMYQLEHGWTIRDGDYAHLYGGTVVDSNPYTFWSDQVRLES